MVQDGSGPTECHPECHPGSRHPADLPVKLHQQHRHPVRAVGHAFPFSRRRATPDPEVVLEGGGQALDEDGHPAQMRFAGSAARISSPKVLRISGNHVSGFRPRQAASACHEGVTET
jgi:hypothetical protein